MFEPYDRIKIGRDGLHVFNEPISLERMVFSGGEVQVRVGKISNPYETIAIRLRARPLNSKDIMTLLMVTDAIRRQVDVPIRLTLPYLPYARQDRVCAEGEALSLKVMCNLINAQKYASVEVWDVHSDVSLALLDGVVNIPAHRFLSRIRYLFKENTMLVSPDAGALKKIYETSKVLGFPVIKADKHRNSYTGEVTGSSVHWTAGNHSTLRSHMLIVDDICDGGRTFIELAKELRKITTGKIDLYVTHGIFSKGFKVFDGLIDTVYVANSFISLQDSKTKFRSVFE